MQPQTIQTFEIMNTTQAIQLDASHFDAQSRLGTKTRSSRYSNALIRGLIVA